MQTIIHPTPTTTIAEITSDGIILSQETDAIPLLEELFSAGARKLILHAENLDPQFFRLRSGLAGAVLQKLVNYQVQVAIIGDFSHVTSEALQAFIYESNRGKEVFFVTNVEDAVEKLSIREFH